MTENYMYVMRNTNENTSLHNVNNTSNHRHSSDGNLDIAPVPQRKKI
jgi:hypothetical protein